MHMMTSWNGNIFRVTGHLCGELTGPRWIPTQSPVMRNFDVFFDCARINCWKNKKGGHYDVIVMRHSYGHLEGPTEVISQISLNVADTVRYYNCAQSVSFVGGTMCGKHTGLKSFSVHRKFATDKITYQPQASIRLWLYTDEGYIQMKACYQSMV